MAIGDIEALRLGAHEASLADAEATLMQLAGLFPQNRIIEQHAMQTAVDGSPNVEARS